MPTLLAANTYPVALALLAGSAGIATLCAVAFQSMARQPEIAPKMQTAMIIGAAMIEGATLFALVVCLINGAN